MTKRCAGLAGDICGDERLPLFFLVVRSYMAFPRRTR
jgi:hypothetical protein